MDSSKAFKMSFSGGKYLSCLELWCFQNKLEVRKKLMTTKGTIPTIDQIMEMSHFTLILRTTKARSIVSKLEATKPAAASLHSAHHVYSASTGPSSQHPPPPQPDPSVSPPSQAGQPPPPLP